LTGGSRLVARARRLAPILLAAWICAPAHATETDDFVSLYAPIADSAPVLNAETNRLIDQALSTLNAAAGDWGSADTPVPDACSETDLYEAISDTLSGSVVGRMETFARESPDVDRVAVEKRASIYRDFSVFETPSLGGDAGRLAPTIRVGRFRFGADKLGHFIDQGFAYFRIAYPGGGSVDEAVQYGDTQERTYFGALLSGIYSYADQAANFQGMRFYTELLGHYPDPLTGRRTDRPLVRCRAGQWVRVRDFDWRRFVDAAWNEAENCSLFRNADLAARVGRVLHDMQERSGRRYACPARHPGEAQIRAHYGRWAALLVNPGGQGVVATPAAGLAHNTSGE